MHMNEVRKIAKMRGLNTFGMKKVDIIRAIQTEEKAIPCYATPRVGECGEQQCLWRFDCQSADAAGKKAARRGA